LWAGRTRWGCGQDAGRPALRTHGPCEGRPQAEDQTTAAWSLPIGAVGGGSTPHHARSGGGPGKGFLADGNPGDDLLDQVPGRLRHAPTGTRRTKPPPLATEGQEHLVVTGVTSQAEKAMGEDAALQIVIVHPYPACPARAKSGKRYAPPRRGNRAPAPRQPRSSAAALCSQHGQSARPAGGRGGSPGCSGWPWLSSAGTPGSAAPDGPGAAPGAGVAVDRWRAGEGPWQALRRQGNDACSCLMPVGWCAGGVRCWHVATLHQAPSGSGAQGRERHAALSSVAISPKGVARCRASSKTRSPYEAVSAAIAFVSTRVTAALVKRRAGVPRVATPALRSCQPIAEES